MKSERCRLQDAEEAKSVMGEAHMLAILGSPVVIGERSHHCNDRIT